MKMKLYIPLMVNIQTAMNKISLLYYILVMAQKKNLTQCPPYTHVNNCAVQKYIP